MRSSSCVSRLRHQSDVRAASADLLPNLLFAMVLRFSTLVVTVLALAAIAAPGAELAPNDMRLLWVRGPLVRWPIGGAGTSEEPAVGVPQEVDGGDDEVEDEPERVGVPPDTEPIEDDPSDSHSGGDPIEDVSDEDPIGNVIDPIEEVGNSDDDVSDATSTVIELSSDGSASICPPEPGPPVLCAEIPAVDNVMGFKTDASRPCTHECAPTQLDDFATEELGSASGTAAPLPSLPSGQAPLRLSRAALKNQRRWFALHGADLSPSGVVLLQQGFWLSLPICFVDSVFLWRRTQTGMLQMRNADEALEQLCFVPWDSLAWWVSEGESNGPEVVNEHT